MPSEDTVASANQNISPNVEIVHVLFMDIVGFGRLSQRIEVQAALINELQEVVRNTPEVRRADTEGELLFRPTGDGMALVFFRDALWPVRAAIEIARELKQRPHIKLRIGIHSGPVYRIRDINFNVDVSGEGIVTAQRVMDFGDAGHILLSSQVAELIGKLEPWSRYIDDIGEWRTKNNISVHLFNFFTKDVGNRKTPTKLSATADAQLSSVRQRAYQTLPVRTMSQGVKNSLFMLFWFFLITGLAGVIGYYVFPKTIGEPMREVFAHWFPSSVAAPNPSNPVPPIKGKPNPIAPNELPTDVSAAPQTAPAAPGKAGKPVDLSDKSSSKTPVVEKPRLTVTHSVRNVPKHWEKEIQLPKDKITGLDTLVFQYTDARGTHLFAPRITEDGDDYWVSFNIRYFGVLTLSVRDGSNELYHGNPEEQEPNFIDPTPSEEDSQESSRN